MKSLPILLIGSVYAILGLFFIRLAIIFSHGTIWNGSSIFLMIMATMNFGLCVRVIIVNLTRDEANIEENI